MSAFHPLRTLQFRLASAFGGSQMSVRQVMMAVAGAAPLSLIAVPAAAQFAPPVALQVQFRVDETRPILAGVAKCSVRKNPALAREFILSNRDYSSNRFRSLLLPECLGEAMGDLSSARLQFSGPVLWYIIADALVSRDLQRFDSDNLRNATPLPDLAIDPPQIPAVEQASVARTPQNLAAAKNDIALIKYGECVVRADPHGSQKLLASTINSKDEAATLSALLPAFGACLDKGRQLASSRMILRGIFAFNYYRLANAPQVVASTVK